MYKPQGRSRQAEKVQPVGFFEGLKRLCFGLVMLVWLVILPVLTLVVIDWIASRLMPPALYGATWSMPFLMGLSAFLGGAFVRQCCEDHSGGITALLMSMLALCLFGLLTYEDIIHFGVIYARILPHVLTHSELFMAPMLPALGLVGMINFKHFTMKHYL